MTLDDLERLRGRGVEPLFNSCESQTLYKDFLCQIATATDEDEIPLAIRTEAVTEVVRQILQELFPRRMSTRQWMRQVKSARSLRMI